MNEFSPYLGMTPIKAAPGDVFEIAMAEFGAPLRNGIAAVETALTPGRVVAL